MHSWADIIDLLLVANPSIYSYLSYRILLEGWENPFKAWAGRRWEACEAVSENQSDRKWKEERSSQSPNIPSKRVPGGHKVKGEGFLDGEPSCVPRGVYKATAAWPQVTTSTRSYL